MATKIIFHKVIQDALEFGSNEQVAVSRVQFDLEHNGQLFENFHVDVEEPADATHEMNEIKVGSFESPVKLNRRAFEQAVCGYYQGLVTSAGYGKHLAKGKGVRSHGDKLGLEQVLEL